LRKFVSAHKKNKEEDVTQFLKHLDKIKID